MGGDVKSSGICTPKAHRSPGNNKYSPLPDILYATHGNLHTSRGGLSVGPVDTIVILPGENAFWLYCTVTVLVHLLLRKIHVNLSHPH